MDRVRPHQGNPSPTAAADTLPGSNQHATARGQPAPLAPNPGTEAEHATTGEAEPHSKRRKIHGTAGSHAQNPTEATPFAVLRAQTLLQQLMPTLVGDQLPLAAEALQLLQSWTSALWGEPIRLTDSDDLEATIPWDPPPAEPLQKDTLLPAGAEAREQVCRQT